MQCKYAYLFSSILVVYCLFFIIILCFYVLSMCCFYSQCVLGLFVCFDVFLGLMIIEKGLELVRTSWKAKRLNFGRMVTVTSHATWDESLESFCNESAPWDDSAQGLKDLEDSGLSNFRILGITSSTDI